GTGGYIAFWNYRVVAEFDGVCPAAEGGVDGEGIGEGVIEGLLDGEGSIEGDLEGAMDGEGGTEGILEGDGEGEGIADGEGIAEGEGVPGGEGIMEGEGEGGAPAPVYFIVANDQPEQGAYVLPLTNEADIAHARAVIADPDNTDAHIASARIDYGSSDG